MNLGNTGNENDAETTLRQELAKLDIKKKSMEHEADAIYLELTTPPGEDIEPMGIDTPLVDQDGYPRGDIDIYRCRTLRRRFRELKSDHKQINDKIREMLVQLSAMKNPSKKEEEEKEMSARRQPKPKPKYDSKTGKWVVMNWDGTVAGVPGGETRKFAELDKQVSGLSGDDDLSSLASSPINSTRSHTTLDNEPHPPAAAGEYTPHGLQKPFARVDAVATGSPAQTAGLLEEDLIVKFGPIYGDNNDHLRAIAGLIPEVAAEEEAIEIHLLRRKFREAAFSSQEDKESWETVSLKLKPKPWSGRGLLGCHIVPYSE